MHNVTLKVEVNTDNLDDAVEELIGLANRTLVTIEAEETLYGVVRSYTVHPHDTQAEIKTRIKEVWRHYGISH